MSSVSTSKSRQGTRQASSRVSTATGQSNSDTKSSRPRGSSASSRAKKVNKTSGDALRAKEEEYMRINAELEAKTSELVREAEELLKGDLSALSDVDPDHSLTLSPLHSSHTHNEHTSPLHSSHTHNEHTSPLHSSHTHNEHTSPLHSAHTHNEHTSHSHDELLTSHSSNPLGANKAGKTASRKTSANRPSTSSAAGLPKPIPQSNRPHSSAQGHPHSKSRAPRPPKANNTIPQANPISVNIDSTVERLEKQWDGSVALSGDGHVDVYSYHGDDVLPEVAEDLGPEATIRFLKAKLRVMQEEMDRLCQENREKDKSLSQSESKLKEVTEQAGKVQRNYQSMAGQVDKYKHSSETFKHKCEGLETQLVALRKEVDGIKGTQRKAASQHSAVEVRLNRALEETEKYKNALQKARSDSKDSSKQDRQRVEQLIVENKQLEKQKSELMAAFKKQMKLIDILKRQKMHIEAAKMLSFTEEEFVKALDWGSS